MSRKRKHCECCHENVDVTIEIDFGTVCVVCCDEQLLGADECGGVGSDPAWNAAGQCAVCEGGRPVPPGSDKGSPSPRICGRGCGLDLNEDAHIHCETCDKRLPKLEYGIGFCDAVCAEGFSP